MDFDSGFDFTNVCDAEQHERQNRSGQPTNIAVAGEKHMDPQTSHNNSHQLESHDLSESSRASSGDNSYTKRRIHMDHLDCRDYTENEGGSRLSNPNATSFSSRDPNRGLYPRERQKQKKGMAPGFQTASEVLNPKLPFESVKVESQESVNAVKQETNMEDKYAWWKGKATGTRKKNLQTQNNKISNYFTKSDPQCSSSQSSPTCSSTPIQPPPLPSSPPSSSSSQGSLSDRDGTKTRKIYSPIKKIEKDADTVFHVMDDDDDFEITAFQVPQPITGKKRPALKSGIGKVSSKTKKQKPAPKFHRNNAFLYSGKPDKPSTSKTNDKYGLLGSGSGDVLSDDDEDEQWNWFDGLPDELLEKILCQLPIFDMMVSATQVCKRWESTISNTKVRRNFFYELILTDNNLVWMS